MSDLLDRANERADATEARADQERQGRERAEARADASDSDRRSADARADRAEARADALRQRVDEVQAGQQLVMDTHARALAEAQDQLARVREAAEDPRQAEVERQGRGFVARLRAAWRRE